MRPHALALIAAFTLSALPAAADCRFTLTFAYGSAQPSLADSLLLGDLARAYPAGPVRLSAHADDDGSLAANARVARARAETVMARLHQSGLQRGAVSEAIAFAATWDAIPATGASSPLNRRVELYIGGCDPRRHAEARPLNAPGVALDHKGTAYLTSPRLPGG